MADPTIPKREKPLDLWLAIGGIVVGIILFIVPKTTATVATSLIIIFALLIHPIWHFWWIEERLWRKLAAALLLVLGLARVWHISQPADADAALQFSERHLGNSWQWIVGPHGRWLDRTIGGVYTLLALFLFLFFVAAVQAFKKARGWSQQSSSNKGFLDYRMDVETAMAALPRLIEELSKIMTEVGSECKPLRRDDLPNSADE